MAAMWTQADLDSLRALFPHRPRGFVAHALRRTESAVLKKAQQLGLERCRKGRFPKQ